LSKLWIKKRVSKVFFNNIGLTIIINLYILQNKQLIHNKLNKIKLVWTLLNSDGYMLSKWIKN